MTLADLALKIPTSAYGLLLAFGIVLYLAQVRFRPGLGKVPGPVIASVTNWWRLYDVLQGSHQQTLIDLHSKYASDLSSFYHVQQNVSQGKPLLNIFNTTDESFHAVIKRPVAHSYSMTSLKQYEPFVDTTSQLLCRELAHRFADSGEMCDLGAWLQYYAFDVIGEITFSKRFGFLETGNDVEGIIADIEWRLRYFATVGQIPKLDRFLLKSPVAMRMIPNNHVVNLSARQVRERMDKPADRKDFLSIFLQAKKDWLELVYDRQVLSYANSNIFAGSDTTAISLRSILYYLLKTPHAMEQVVAEIDNTVGDRDCSRNPVSFSEASKMPYLQAVIKQSMRMHPAVGMILERIVPANGVSVAGVFLPAGTCVGICPWVLHRDKRVFGEDADTFRPERWLEASEETLKRMEKSNLAVRVYSIP